VKDQDPEAVRLTPVRGEGTGGYSNAQSSVPSGEKSEQKKLGRSSLL